MHAVLCLFTVIAMSCQNSSSAVLLICASAQLTLARTAAFDMQRLECGRGSSHDACALLRVGHPMGITHFACALLLVRHQC
ncbi:hypothetical protein COO60DRAFT_1524469 [Scenedesmus sp. NREL 46B-D3]|nr:hypothetical protein COO60DRAFT_1524469 [Scenedesmus sp. NREL 46B-D3]